MVREGRLPRVAREWGRKSIPAEGTASAQKEAGTSLCLLSCFLLSFGLVPVWST